MAADDKDFENQSGKTESVVDIEMEDKSPGLSAGKRSEFDDDDFDSDLDVDITGDENIDFADEDSGSSAGGGGKLSKIVAPALVLVIAAGVGGYIVMNPQVIEKLTGGAEPAAVASYAAPAAKSAPVSDVAANDITEEASVAEAGEMFSDSLPQPTVNQNEIPRPPEADITEVAAVGEPVAPAGFEASEHVSEADVEPASEPEFPGTESAEVVELETAAADPFVAEGAEQGSADQPEDSAEALAAAAQEPAAPQDEVFEVKFTNEKPVAPTPVAEAPPVAEAAVEPIELAQAEITNTEPPAMPSSPPEAPAAPPAASPSETASGTVAQPVAPSQGSPASDVYYDGRIPTGPMATELGPRKVDPVLEPASQFVVVKKTHEANDSEALLVSASRALELKRYDSALEMYNQLYDKNKRDPRILMGRAVTLQNLNMVESAIKAYEELLDIDPKNADAMLNMLGLLRQQYPSVALRRLMELHDKYPNNAGVAAQIGVTQADLGQPQDAMRYLGIASTLEPRNAQHMFNMAIIADRAGDTASAVKYYEQALELDAVYSSGRSIPRESVYDRLSTLRRR